MVAFGWLYKSKPILPTLNVVNELSPTIDQSVKSTETVTITGEQQKSSSNGFVDDDRYRWLCSTFHITTAAWTIAIIYAVQLALSAIAMYPSIVDRIHFDQHSIGVFIVNALFLASIIYGLHRKQAYALLPYIICEISSTIFQMLLVLYTIIYGVVNYENFDFYLQKEQITALLSIAFCFLYRLSSIYILIRCCGYFYDLNHHHQTNSQYRRRNIKRPHYLDLSSSEHNPYSTKSSRIISHEYAHITYENKRKSFIRSAMNV